MQYQGACKCGELLEVELKFAPKFLGHSTRCDSCGRRVLMKKSGQARPEPFTMELRPTDLWITLIALKCEKCGQRTGFVNRGEQVRVGKTYCSMSCASDILESMYVRCMEP